MLESGAQTATRALWQRFHTDLLQFILRRVGDGALADDLLQEVFLRVHERLPSLKDDTRVGAWVYRIARNVIADHFRRVRPSEPPDELTAEIPNDDNENLVVGSWLRNMIDDLPPDYREALTLAEVDNLTQREVAERLGLSLSGAKSRVQRGREQLRRMLARCCHVELDTRGNAIDYTPKPGCC